MGLEEHEPSLPLLASASAISFNAFLSHPLWGTSCAPPGHTGGSSIYAARPGLVSLSCAFCMLGEGLDVTAAHA